MGKNKLVPHLAAIVVIVVFGVMALSSGATPPAVVEAVAGQETIVSSVTESRGTVHNMPGPEGRAYDTLGLVFATSQTKFDPEGREISSEEGIVTMLLREAHKLGADDILNYRIDENTTFVQTTTETPAKTGSGVTKTTVTTRNVTYTGSALAIKYKEAPATATADSGLFSDSRLVPGKITVEANFNN